MQCHNKFLDVVNEIKNLKLLHLQNYRFNWIFDIAFTSPKLFVQRPSGQAHSKIEFNCLNLCCWEKNCISYKWTF